MDPCIYPNKLFAPVRPIRRNKTLSVVICNITNGALQLHLQPWATRTSLQRKLEFQCQSFIRIYERGWKFCTIMPTFKKLHQLKDLGSRKWRGLVSLVGLASHVGPHLLPTVSLSTKYKRLRQVIMESRNPCPLRHDVITHCGQKFSKMRCNFIPCTEIYIRYGFNKNEKCFNSSRPEVGQLRLH